MTSLASHRLPVTPYLCALLRCGSIGLWLTCGATAASAFDTAPIVTFDKGVVVAPNCTEMFPKLPELASRLGVQRNLMLDGHSVALSMCDGTSYDLFALINAALDRLDKVSH